MNPKTYEFTAVGEPYGSSASSFWLPTLWDNGANVSRCISLWHMVPEKWKAAIFHPVRPRSGVACGEEENRGA